MIATQPVALVANKSFAPNTVPEIVAHAKASAEPLNYTSPGPRGVGHLAGELLQQRAGIKMQHINYNGSAPALVDLMAGRVPMMFDIWHSAKRYVDTGQIKLIAGASAERLSDMPNTPTIAESYPGFAVMAMNALFAPSGVPAPVIAKVSSDVREIVESTAFRDKTKHLGIHTWGTTPQELDAWTRSEIANWAKVAKAANIKVD
jgi:tripartite-type tricarboxylate transporter receptor subunit TctC